MKRREILQRLGFAVPDNRKKRVILHSDIAAEADDNFAVAHHLLSPSEDVVGIIAANFEWRFRTSRSPTMLAQRLTSMEQSYTAGQKLLEAMDIDDVPLLRGAVDCIIDRENPGVSEGAQFIIDEAMKDSDKPLFIVLQAGLTDLAQAYLAKPEIAQRLTAIWIGGGSYPEGGNESNLKQDIYAAQVLFASPMPIWQIPLNVYSTMNFSIAEMMAKVKPCGKVGQLMVERTLKVNDFYGKIPLRLEFPHGESWSIGDQPTVSVLLENAAGLDYSIQPAPIIGDDMSYTADPNGKPIRVYNSIDRRLTLDDLCAKLKLCYGE